MGGSRSTKRSRTNAQGAGRSTATGSKLGGSSKRKTPSSKRPAKSCNEVGYVDYAISTVPATTTGDIYHANIVGVGPGNSQRIGKRISLKSLQFRGTVAANIASGVANALMLVVYDKRPTGTMPTIGDILNSVSPFAMNKDANSGRFRILKRQTWEVVGAQASGWMTAKSLHNIDFYLNCKDRPTVFKEAGSGAIGDIEEGAVYVVILSDVPTGSNAHPIFTLAHRVRYNDV